MSIEGTIDALEDQFQRAPRCAVHPEREARRAPCERCGAFACEECFGTSSEERCAGCRVRVGETLAWERPDLGGPLLRAWETTKQLLPEPFRSFEGLREGRGVASAAAFASTTNVVSHALPLLLCSPCVLLGLGAIRYDDLPRDIDRDAFVLLLLVGLVCAPFVAALFALFGALLTAAVYHLAAVVAGGAASFGSSLRACLFLQVLAPIGVAAWTLGRIPLVGILITLAWWVGSLVWQTFALAGHAHGAHRIEGQRAWLVGAMPALVGIGLFVAAFGLLLLFAAFVAAVDDPSFVD